MSRLLRVGCLGLLLLVGADPPASAPAPGQSMTLDLGGGVSVELVLIRPGSFVMGSERGEADEMPSHKVILTKPFYLGKYEVTQAQWQAVMGENPSQFKGTNHPVDNVSWDDSQIFMQKLGERIKGGTVQLPTEAQWEYACRAGGGTEYSYGNDAAALGEYAWFHGNSGAASHPVGQKRANSWGLYDMHGNVCEWCADWYAGGYPAGEATDPSGASSGDARVLRGESWVSTGETLRSAYRVGTPPEYRNSHVGLRVAFIPQATQE